MSKSIKSKITDNILVAMMDYIDTNSLQILERIIMDELVAVNVEEITTLPVEYKDTAGQKNKYIIQLFLIKRKSLKDKTKEGYLNAVKRLITAIDYKSLDQMDENDIEWYLNQYERRNVSSGGRINKPRTVNNERRYLSAFYTWMRKAKLISDNPVEGIELLKEVQKPIDYYTPEEVAQLRDACTTVRERAILEVFRSTGARVGEIAEIRTEQVNLNTGDILILSEKSNQYRMIYLDADARHYYRMYLESRADDSPYMFVSCSPPHSKLSTDGYRGLFKRIGIRAGIKTRVYPHKMRKTLGMNLKNKGCDLGTIQEILGHKSPMVTAMYYAQSTPETLRQVRVRAS